MSSSSRKRRNSDWDIPDRSPVVAVYDANVLYPAPIRDLLIRLARAGLVGARWTKTIQDEWITNLLENRPDLSLQHLLRTRAMMEEVVPGAVVEGYERHIPALQLPDPDDRHVLAAAIETKAAIIVTADIKDFPISVVSRYGVEVEHPDAFVLRLMAVDPELVYAAARAQRTNLRRPALSVEKYLANLRKVRLRRTADALEAVAHLL
ncbi:PIN domain-containing protein [Longimicrobium sp.]|jgi:predicted nucleic acid-binding protein|uniref:PIN domain-containing protein n=1 Tax=Longimicrobium sp. TaxID=2029185 RepID=UPI002ED90A1D